MSPLSSAELNLLRWLGMEKFTPYRDCDEKTLGALIANGLAQLHLPGQHRCEASITLTDPARALLPIINQAVLNDGKQQLARVIEAKTLLLEGLRHLIDHGRVELGTAQSRKLVRANALIAQVLNPQAPEPPPLIAPCANCEAAGCSSCLTDPD